ncbi:alpha/beta fold hydrolase [Pengzhenrongella frigida]|uniref:alpha/beta fold hydrolase n=1 Tax=Pengzhenrongella frigida TaxID=1259133 RepID=UPI0013EA293D|nr:alpha/beta hydrolase [Cellulomonas sp. HLT2-17]
MNIKTRRRSSDHVEHGTLGRGLAYVRRGSGPPLVVAAAITPTHRPPTGSDLTFVLRQLRPLAAERTVWWVNRRPGLDPTASMADIADDYADVLSGISDGPVDVMGISTGGSVALQLTCDHPELVRRLVMVASGCRLGTRGKASLLRATTQVRARNPRGTAQEFAGMLAAKRWSWATFRSVGWLLGSAFWPIDDADDLLATIQAEDRFDLTDRLHEIRAPVLVVGGTRDLYYDGANVFVLTADRIPDARLILYPGKGHLGTVSNRRLPRDVLAFLAEDSPA